MTTVLWWLIGLAGLWLGLLGIAMAVGLARILRSGKEIPEDYWRSLVNYFYLIPLLTLAVVLAEPAQRRVLRRARA